MDESTRGRVRVERGEKRVRTFLGGNLVADTVNPLYVWEVPYYPTYYLPASDVTAELVPTGDTSHSPSRGDAQHLSVRVRDAEARDAAVRFPDSPVVELRDHVRSPHTRVDILPSSRHVVVRLGDTVLADSTRAHALFETLLPVRWYVPRTDVRMDLLSPSDTVTHCPYKGEPEHFSARVGGNEVKDVAWSYPTPLPESQRIAGLVAFYDDRTEVTVDGERQGSSS